MGQRFRHATPRTITQGDSSLYIAFTGARQPLFCSIPLARAMGYESAPIDDMLVFNIAFGKTVTDISANAVANLGYADVRFLNPVFAGDTVSADSEVIGVRPTSGGQNGVVYVRSNARNQHGQTVMTWIRWVLVHKKEMATPAPEAVIPELPAMVVGADLPIPKCKIDRNVLALATGASRWWEDYAVGERIDHPAGMTLDESDHTLATKLYQNTAKVHFDAHLMKDTPHKRRLVYGGHVISVCQALSYDGLENVLGILAINGGSHSAPTFAGDTIYCWTEVVEKIELPGFNDRAALRLRRFGVKNHAPHGFEGEQIVAGKSRLHPDVVLSLDFTVMIPRG